MLPFLKYFVECKNRFILIIYYVIFKLLQKLAHKSTSAVNKDNINVMAENMLDSSDEYVRWFVEYCHDMELSKTLFFLILLQSLMKPQKG